MIWLLAVYLVGIIPSFVAIAGWEYAHYREHSSFSARYDWGGAVIGAAIGCLGWPIWLPLIWMSTGFAESGWQWYKRADRNRRRSSSGE